MQDNNVWFECFWQGWILIHIHSYQRPIFFRHPSNLELEFSVLFTDVTYLAESADDLVKLADDFVITWYIC